MSGVNVTLTGASTSSMDIRDEQPQEPRWRYRISPTEPGATLEIREPTDEERAAWFTDSDGTEYLDGEDVPLL